MKKKILWVAFAILSGNLLQAATKAPTETPLTKSWGHCPSQGYKDTSKGVCITCDPGYTLSTDHTQCVSAATPAPATHTPPARVERTPAPATHTPPAPTETPLTKSWGHCPQGYKDTSKGVCITCDSGYKYNNTTKTCENNK